jgi:malate dehydrogenase (oxaloacetate-decarboxylating)
MLFSLSQTPSPGYSITIRVQIRNRPGGLGRLTTEIGRVGGDIAAVDIVHVGHDVLTRDVTVNAASVAHGEQIVAAIRAVDGVEVINVSDRTFLMHLGGKIEVRSKVPLHTRADLSMAYTEDRRPKPIQNHELFGPFHIEIRQRTSW